jgi:hypothetical protein
MTSDDHAEANETMADHSKEETSGDFLNNEQPLSSSSLKEESRQSEELQAKPGECNCTELLRSLSYLSQQLEEAKQRLLEQNTQQTSTSSSASIPDDTCFSKKEDTIIKKKSTKVKKIKHNKPAKDKKIKNKKI